MFNITAKGFCTNSLLKPLSLKGQLRVEEKFFQKAPFFIFYFFANKSGLIYYK